MGQRVLRFQEEPPGDVPVAVIEQTAIAGDQSLPVPAINGRQVVPGNSGLQVMQHSRLL
jgi:hypothetical protein